MIAATEPSEPLDDSIIGRLLSMTARAVRADAEAYLAPHGADLTTWIVLNAATRAPTNGFSQRQLAEGMGIGGPALIRHIDRLEKQRLVCRQRDEADRRVTRITITPSGKRLHRRLEKVMVAKDQELRAHLDADEREALVRILRKLHDFAVSDTRSAERPAT